MNTDFFVTARNHLENLPADAPEWASDVPEFLNFLTGVLESKRTERESAAIGEALNLEISVLLERFAGKVENHESGPSKWEYLELDISSWRAPLGLSDTRASEIKGLLVTFGGFIEEYYAIPNEGSSVSETRLLREEQEDILRRILETKEQLDQVLNSEIGPGDGPDELPVGLPDSEEGMKETVGGLLSDIELSDGVLDFSSMATDYYVNLESGVDRLTLTPTAIDGDAQIDVTVETPGAGHIYTLKPEKGTYCVEGLKAGSTIIYVKVRSLASNVSKTYSLTLSRGPSSEAKLKSLELSVGEFDFTPEGTAYNVDLKHGINSLVIVPEPAQDGASVTVSCSYPNGTEVEGFPTSGGGFEIGEVIDDDSEVTLRVRVTAEDKETTQTYTVILKSRQAVPDLGAGLWSLVDRDDLSGAYWAARIMADQGVEPPVAPALLMAVQGARWLSPDSDKYVGELFEIVDEWEGWEDGAHVLLGLAASLMPSVVAPETNLLAWLSSPDCLPALEAVVSPVRAYANTGYRLLPEYITDDEGNQHLQTLIAQASASATRWLDESPHFYNKFNRALIVWQHLCKEGLLYQMLVTVSADNREELDTVRTYIGNLNRDGSFEIINQTDRLLSGPPRKGEIVGNARDWLVKRIEEAKAHAKEWCELVAREIAMRHSESERWRVEQASSLRNQLAMECPMALDALSQLADDSQKPDIAAAAKCAARSLLQLVEYLNLEIQGRQPLEAQTVIGDLRAVNENAGPPAEGSSGEGQLKIDVTRRLLWIPSVALDDFGLLQSEDSLVGFSQLAEDWNSSDTPLEVAIEHRMDRRDFRFFNLMAARLPPEKHGQLKDTYSARLVLEHNTLKEAIDSTVASVDQAAKDGVIEYEGSQWNEYVNALSDVAAAEQFNFDPIHDRLEAIKRRLDEDGMQRRGELLGEWEKLTLESVGDTDIEKDFFDGLRDTFQMASNPSSLDIRVMEDCVSRVRNYRSGEDGSGFFTISEAGQPDTLKAFLTFSSEVRDPFSTSGIGNRLNRLVQELKGEV